MVYKKQVCFDNYKTRAFYMLALKAEKYKGLFLQGIDFLLTIIRFPLHHICTIIY